MFRMDVKISVRSLVEFILRSGDIDNRTDSGYDTDAMQAGSRIHKRIQKSMGKQYRPEVSLSRTFTDGDLNLTVEGRADGILTDENGILIDEIKGIYADIHFLKEPYPLHLAQVKCYAAIFSNQEKTDPVLCRVTYASLSREEEERKHRLTDNLKQFTYSFSASELEEWMQDVVGKYFRWARFLSNHIEERDQSAAEISFPFPYREGQKKTAVDVYRSIKRSRNLFIQAPTGVGKTLSVLFPSVKAVGEGLSSRIFYLTAKTVTGNAALDAFSLLEKHGLLFKTVMITAKEKACANDVFECNPDACPYAKGHFDRINDAVFSILSEENLITRTTIETYAKRYKVCPYEFSLDISSWCDAVVGDYNYVFDPRVHLRRFFSGEGEKDYIFLIDEAHNLISRASEMYSAVLYKEDILKIKRLTGKMSKRLTNALTQCSREMLSLKRISEDAYTDAGGGEPHKKKEITVLKNIDTLSQKLIGLDSELKKFLEEHKKFPDRDQAVDFFFEVRTFLDTCVHTGEGYRIYAGFTKEKVFFVKLLCIDPSHNLNEYFSQCRSAVFFSATLLPVNYYKTLLTGNTDEYAILAESPFHAKNRLLAIGRDVTSRYVKRNDAEYRKIADYIRKTAQVRRGNYLCFFPSYEFLEKVSGFLDEESFRLIRQSRHMTEEEREQFLSKFDSAKEETQVGLCVMGGIFAEGIDLTDEKLIGALIIGTGLPMINPESELAREYFDEKGEPGFDYAYRFPGMNKVMQAAGRVIRTDTDRGVILLLDERFLFSSYKTLFPREWEEHEITDLKGVSALLRNFWKTT